MHVAPDLILPVWFAALLVVAELAGFVFFEVGVIGACRDRTVIVDRRPLALLGFLAVGTLVALGWWAYLPIAAIGDA